MLKCIPYIYYILNYGGKSYGNYKEYENVVLATTTYNNGIFPIMHDFVDRLSLKILFD